METTSQQQDKKLATKAEINVQSKNVSWLTEPNRIRPSCTEQNKLTMVRSTSTRVGTSRSVVIIALAVGSGGHGQSIF